MPNTDAKLARKLIDALNTAIETGPWSKGLLFEAIGNKLKLLRDQFQQELDVSIEEQSPTSQQNSLSKTGESSWVLAYLSLYIIEGNDIKKWEKLLSNLGSNIVTRPIYKNEEDLLTALRAKETKLNDAYVCVRLRAADIINPPDNMPPVDRFGHELLIVRQGGISSSNIVYFIHNNLRYKFEKQELVRL